MAQTKDKVNGIVKKNKRISKKNKTAWRKHCSTKDVDAFLEEGRLEERIGVKFDTVEDERLFFEDKEPETCRSISIAERKLQAKKKLEGIPKCWSVLINCSSVPDPVIKRNKVGTSRKKKDSIVKSVELSHETHDAPKSREIGKKKDLRRNRKVVEERTLNALKIDVVERDLWEDEEKSMDLAWLHKNTVYHVFKNTGKTKKLVPCSITNKTSILPPVEVPHPGASYNPSLRDHRALLEGIVDKEKEVIKQDAHLNRVTNAMFSAVTVERNEKNWINEMSEGLSVAGKVIIKEEDDGIGYKAVNPPALDKKKTQKKRRNIKQANEELQKRNLKAVEKKKIADIYKLKNIMQNLKKYEIKSLKRKEMLEKRKEKSKLETKRLALLKFEEPEEDFNMPYDLSGNLRGIKSEGSILFDRFKSMQKRNILQPVKVQRVKRGKKKTFTKSTHKES